MTVYNLLGESSGVANGHTGQATFDVVHPATGKVVHAVQSSTAADLSKAVDICAEGFPSWSSTPLSQRCAIIRKVGELVADKSSGWFHKLRDANMAETSVTHWWASTQLGEIPHFMDTLASSAEKVLVDETLDEGTSNVILSREPYGVCLAIAAWNAAHLLTSRAIVTPLLAGNTVVLKSSEIVPLTQNTWAELLFAAGVPRTALCVVHVATSDSAKLTPALIADRRIRHVNFTGSTRVGSILAGLAGQHLKPCVMELGGKAPVVLLPDADLEVAAYHIIFGAWMNAGQICMSTEKVVVSASQYDKLASCLQAAWETIKEKQTRSMFTSTSGTRIKGLIKNAVDSGAVYIIQTDPGSSDKDAHIRPAILGKVTENMALYREESFGPITGVITVPDEGRSETDVIDQMVKIANDTEYGLTAAVWSRDVGKAQKVARRIESGAVHINGPANGDHAEVPHGGWKMSGWGRFNSVEGIRSFTQTRSIEVPKEAPHPLPLNVFEL